MKGRSCIAVFIAIVALLFTAISGYTKTTVNSAKALTGQKKIKRDSEQPGQGQEYKVRRGDNLTSIAREFGTTPAAIKSANGLRSSRIKAGQFLNIPVAKTAAAEKESKAVETRQESATQAQAGLPPDETQKTDSEASATPLRLVQAGFQFLGVRYRFGGSGKSGIDCSGLVKTLFSKFNIELPRSSREQYKQGQKVSRDELKMGDLVFFSSGGSQPTHVGIYIGDDKILHAARKAKQVIVSDINKIWYRMRYLGARRVLDLWSDESLPETNN